MGNGTSLTATGSQGPGGRVRAAKRNRTEEEESPVGPPLIVRTNAKVTGLENEVARLKCQLVEVHKERDALQEELNDWKDGEGRRAVVLGRDMSGKSISDETRKMMNIVAGHTESAEIIRLRDELYKTKDCLQHVQHLAKEHSEDYELAICAGRGHDVLQYVDDPVRKKKLREMIREARQPGQSGDYAWGFQMGMLAAGRLYDEFASAVDDEYPDYCDGYPLTPDERRSMALDNFPSGDT